MGSEERHPGRLAPAAVVPSTIDARTRRILAALPSIIDRIGTGSELRTSLHELLPVIGVVAGVDRVRFVDLRRLDGGPTRKDQIEWEADRKTSEIEIPSGSRLDRLLDGYLDALHDEEPLVIRPGTSEPSSGRSAAPIPAEEVVLVPIVIEGDMRGFLGLESSSGGVDWSEVEIGLLRLIGVEISNALARDEATSEVMQAERMAALGRMSGGVAHDLNNLLAIFGATAELSRLGLETGDPMRRTALENLDTADRAMTRAADLLRSLSGFSGSRTGDPEAIHMGEFLASLESSLRKMVGRSIRFDLDLDGMSDEAMIRMDRSQLRQVIVTLINNARDSMPEGGSIRLQVTGGESDSGSMLSLRVTDDGTGMTEAIRSRVFEPFFTTKPREQGVGLGLASVYAAVRAIGGRIKVDSIPGLGTSFVLDLPCWVEEDAGIGPVVATETGA